MLPAYSYFRTLKTRQFSSNLHGEIFPKLFFSPNFGFLPKHKEFVAKYSILSLGQDFVNFFPKKSRQIENG
jgi:hypothetical protein